MAVQNWYYAPQEGVRPFPPCPEIHGDQQEGRPDDAGFAALRVREAALPALQAGAADQAKPSFLRYVLAAAITPIWLFALPVAFLILVCLFMLSPVLFLAASRSPKCNELFSWIADNCSKAFRTVVFLPLIIAGEEVGEDVFFREAPNEAVQDDANLLNEGEEVYPLLRDEMRVDGLIKAFEEEGQ